MGKNQGSDSSGPQKVLSEDYHRNSTYKKNGMNLYRKRLDPFLIEHKVFKFNNYNI